MIPILVIVGAAVLFAVAMVAVLDRVGVLPRMGGGGGGSGSWDLNDGPPRPAMIAALLLMVAWVFAWIVLLIIGLALLST